MRLRKTLPADIGQIIASGDVEAISQVAANYDDNDSADNIEGGLIHMCVKRARLDQIPVLIERGADINARNTSGKTPLFEVVKSYSVVDVERMILWGADPCVTASLRNLGEVTLVEYLLDKSNFVDTPRVLAIVRVLRSFGAPAGERVVRMLQSKDRECYRFSTHGLPPNITRAEFDDAAASLRKLCALFGVEQREVKPALKVGERLDLDSSVPPLYQYGDLWDRLVPDSGQCETLQGEVIRIVGRISYEVCGEGRQKRGRSLRVLLNEYIRLVSSLQSLPPDELSRAKAAVVSLMRRNADMKSVDEIAELAVEWVRLNPVLRAADFAFHMPLWKKSERAAYRVLGVILVVIILGLLRCSRATLLLRVDHASGSFLTLMYFGPVCLLGFLILFGHVRSGGDRRFVTAMRLILVFVYILTFWLVCWLLSGDGMAFYIGFGEVGRNLVSTYEVFFIYVIFCVCSLFQCWLIASEQWRDEMRTIVGGGLAIVSILMPKLLESYSILRAYSSNRWCLVAEEEGAVLYDVAIAHAASLLTLFVVGLFSPWIMSVIQQLMHLLVDRPHFVASYLIEKPLEVVDSGTPSREHFDAVGEGSVVTSAASCKPHSEAVSRLLVGSAVSGLVAGACFSVVSRLFSRR